MKLSRVLAVLGVLSAVVACQQVTSTGNATISGPQDIALINADGGLLLITSTDTDELRVLDLTKRKTPDFVRAPNPLEALSIPVLAQPSGLARDVAYDGTGLEVTGPFAYVRSSGSPEISIVPVDRSAGGLVEAKRLVAPAAVTTFSSRGPDPTHPYSRLYVATYDGQQGALYETIVSPRAADGTVATSGFQALTFAQPLQPGETVVDVLPIPGSQQLAIATHYGLAGGRAFRFNPEDTSVPTVTLKFPAPVKKLRSHGTGGTSSPAGHRIFGILDETSCYSGRACSGIFAVENIESNTDSRLSPANPGGAYADGDPSRDWSGNAMIPLTTGVGGVIEDLQVEPNALIYVPDYTPANGFATCSAAAVCPLDLLGSFTVTGTSLTYAPGGTYFFDAAQLDVIDLNFVHGPEVTGIAAFDSSGAVVDAGLADHGPDLGSFVLTDGLINPQGESLVATYQGVLPGFTSIQVTGTTVTVAPPELQDRLVDQDSLVVGTQNGCAGFEVPITVSGATLTIPTALPAECTDFSVNGVAIRANGTKPYVVTATLSGYLGRYGTPDANDAGVTTSFRADSAGASAAYYHPHIFAAGSPPVTFNSRQQDPAIVRDSYYEIPVSSGYQADAYILDPITFYNPPYLLPTSVTYFRDRNSTNPLARVYTLYPASNHVVEIPITDLTLWNPFVTVGFQSVIFYPSIRY